MGTMMDRRPTVPHEPQREPLGSVARDTIDHASMLLRDEVKIARLSASRYAEHVRRDVAPMALWTTAAGVAGALAAVMLLVGIFLGLAEALGSVAWTFVIYAAAFAGAGGVAWTMRARVEKHPTAEDLSRRFPSVRAQASRPEHALTQAEQPAAHAEAKREAAREAAHEVAREAAAPRP
jgi:hypothetical protein